MRILLVEDKPDFAEEIDGALRKIDGCDVIWKQSKVSALAAISEEPFDVVLLDRRIPSEDGFLDDDASHGWEVFDNIYWQFPGTSVWFLTGTEDSDFAVDLLNEYGRNGDIHACGREDSVYRVFWKRRMTDCIIAARAFRYDLERTEAISLQLVGNQINLRSEEARLLKLFGRKHGGVSVEARQLGGGLSGARVLRVTAFNAAGKRILSSIAKIGNFLEIEEERGRYYGEITRLIPGSTPHFTADITLGASGHAGIFYSIVGTEVTDLFSILDGEPQEAVSVPEKLRAAQVNWLAAREVEQVRVGTVRRRLIGDATLPKIQHELRGIEISMVEHIELNVMHCVQHGDLHCANVLFDDRGLPMLIDYPNTRRAFASLDPVTLELSTIFHKQAAKHEWPSEEQARNWPDISTFARGAPFEAYLRSCRDWAVSVAGSEEEVWAVGYAYALRQLKYEDTDKRLARAIIQGCSAALGRTAKCFP